MLTEEINRLNNSPSGNKPQRSYAIPTFNNNSNLSVPKPTDRVFQVDLTEYTKTKKLNPRMNLRDDKFSLDAFYGNEPVTPANNETKTKHDAQ